MPPIVAEEEDANTSSSLNELSPSPNELSTSIAIVDGKEKTKKQKNINLMYDFCSSIIVYYNNCLHM